MGQVLTTYILPQIETYDYRYPESAK